MWFAHVTVANIVCKDSKFLIVKELSEGREVYNQPAGHLEDNENLIEAVIRETLEETRWHVKPVSALGISQFKTANGGTYLRHTFISDALSEDKDSLLDPDIIDVHWLSYEEILEKSGSLRSPMVLQDLKRYQNGARFKLNDLYHTS